MSSSFLLAVCLLACIGGVHVQGAYIAGITPVSIEGSAVVFEGRYLQARLPKEWPRPGIFLFPRDENGEVIESMWVLLQPLGLLEVKCNRVVQQENTTGTIYDQRGTLEECDLNSQFQFNFSKAELTRELVSRNEVRSRFRGLGSSPHSELIVSFANIGEPETRTFTNENGVSRNITVRGNTIKFSIELVNFESEVLPSFNETDQYSQLRMQVQLTLSHNLEPYIVNGTGRPNWPSSDSNLTAQLGEYQFATSFYAKDRLFQIDFVKTSFSLNNPPTASKKVLPEAEWGFEAVAAGYSQWDTGSLEPTQNTIFLEFMLVGSTNVTYDPDVSVLVNPDGEEGGDEDDDNDTKIAIAVGVVVPVVVLVAVVIMIVGWMAQRRKAAKRAERIRRTSEVMKKSLQD
ncbi:hypothetical protein QOT17_002962 [Balamuthia mandrillaris]